LQVTTSLDKDFLSISGIRTEETDRLRDKQTNKYTDRHTGRQTNINKEAGISLFGSSCNQ